MSQASRAVRVLILRTAGTNCDYETAYAFDKVGARAERIHVNRVLEKNDLLREFQILGIPGGFSYGDDLGSGKILANELRFALEEELRRFIEDGKLIIGICNGFQVLVKAGFLPALDGYRRQATLTFNDSNRFEDRWVKLRADTDKCVWVNPGQDCYFPVAHGEGKFVPGDDAVLQQLNEAGQVVFRYVAPDGKSAGYPWNPNGSIDDIAGICDPTGRIFGLMPHPERHVEPTHHPRWTREGLKEEGDGVAVFRNAVEYAKANL